jgi:hypothetical protein
MGLGSGRFAVILSSVRHTGIGILNLLNKFIPHAADAYTKGDTSKTSTLGGSETSRLSSLLPNRRSDAIRTESGPKGWPTSARNERQWHLNPELKSHVFLIAVVLSYPAAAKEPHHHRMSRYPGDTNASLSYSGSHCCARHAETSG